jgi:DNA processing protein
MITDHLYWNALRHCSALDRTIFEGARARNLGAKDLWDARESDLRSWIANHLFLSELLDLRKHTNPEKLWKSLERNHIACVFLSDPGYPRLLKEIPDAPPVLYVRGTLPPNPVRSLAVVGSRHESDYGRGVAEALIPAMVQEGIEIVSGLAYGVDSTAHRIALRQSGQTGAVLPSGLDSAHLYPAAHARLAEQILEREGFLVSEYPPGTQARKHYFPARNRIIAGLTHGTCVVEGRAKSGTRITAFLALEYHRDVFAVPGNIFYPGSETPNALLRLGAIPLTNIRDILDIFGWESQIQPLVSRFLDPVQSSLLQLLVDRPQHIEQLQQQCSLSPQTLRLTLTEMELDGIIKQVDPLTYIAQ